MNNTFYKLIDINNSCLAISNRKSEIVTKKLKLIVRHREYKVSHLSKFLKIEKCEGKIYKHN